PTQALAMRWARRRLHGDESRIERLIERLAVWRATEMPEEIGVRTLSALQAAIHCNAAAVLVDGPRGLELLASRDVERADRLAGALRAARKRAQHAESVHSKLGSVEERLARLEQSGPRLSPT